MTLYLVTLIYDFLYAKCCVIYILLDRITSNQIKSLRVFSQVLVLKGNLGKNKS